MSTTRPKGQVAKKAPAGKKQPSAKSSTGKIVAKTSGTIEKAEKTEKPEKTVEKVKKFELPAFSIPYVAKSTESELAKLRKKTIRRNAPPGEDLKAIKAILQSIKRQTITVQEFIGLIGPSTGDKGETLRQVMNDDLVAFRKLARKVYDTITQDNSDVLLNQQIQLNEYYKEKKNLFNHKMMKMIEEIYMLIPNFDFERYMAEQEKYLEEMLPIPEEVKVEPEEMEMMKRQAAYHRLQWLRSEGERLNEENASLKRRLNQLKRQHVDEQQKMVEMEKMAEAKKEALEEEEAEKQETLEMLNRSLEKTLIAQEKALRVSVDENALATGPSTGAVRKQVKGKAKKKVRRPKWNEIAASEIESRVLEEGKNTEMNKIAKRDPFHFSPIKTPPPKPPKELSPFHFSPIKTPPPKPAKELSPFHYSPPPAAPEAAYASPPRAETRAPPPPEVQDQTPVFRGRRVQAPRDAWGGFY